MESIRNPTGYATSRDYNLLYSEAQRQSIICLCQHGNDCIDIAHTIWGSNILSVSARGAGYVCAENIDDFLEQCEECNLEWIAPNNAMNAEERLKLIKPLLSEVARRAEKMGVEDNGMDFTVTISQEMWEHIKDGI